MIIRKPTTGDLEHIAAMHAEAITHSCRSHYTPAQIKAWIDVLDPAAYESAFTDKHFIVACDGDTILGLGIMDIEKNEINALYVAPDHAGQGVGSRISSELEKVARQQGVTQLTVFSTLNARQFYLKKGYQVHRPAAHSLPNGLKLECIEMHKQLN